MKRQLFIKWVAFSFIGIFNLNSAYALEKEFDVSADQLLAVRGVEKLVALTKLVNAKSLAQARADKYCTQLKPSKWDGASSWRAAPGARSLGGNLVFNVNGAERLIRSFWFSTITCVKKDAEDSSSLKDDVTLLLGKMAECKQLTDGTWTGNCADLVKKLLGDETATTPGAAQTAVASAPTAPAGAYKEETRLNVDDISSVKQHVELLLSQGYAKHEILVVLDAESLAQQHLFNGSTTPRANAREVVQALSQYGVHMIASSAQSDFRDTQVTLNNIGLFDAFNMNVTSAAQGERVFHDHSANQDVTVKFNQRGNTLSAAQMPNLTSYHLQTALTPSLALPPDALSRVKRVIVVNQQKAIQEHFKVDANRFKPFPSAEQIDYFNLNSFAPLISGIGPFGVQDSSVAGPNQATSLPLGIITAHSLPDLVPNPAGNFTQPLFGAQNGQPRAAAPQPLPANPPAPPQGGNGGHHHGGGGWPHH